MAVDENASGVVLRVIRRFPPLALGIILAMDIYIEVVAFKVVPRPRLRAALGALKKRVDRPGHIGSVVVEKGSTLRSLGPQLGIIVIRRRISFDTIFRISTSST